MRGATKGSKGLRRKGIKVEENGAIRKEAENPGACSSIDTQGSKCGNHDLGLDVVEEMGEIEKENAADLIGGDAIPGLEAQEGSSIRSGEEFPGPKLAGAQKVVM